MAKPTQPDLLARRKPTQREREALGWLLGKLEFGPCVTPGCIYQEHVTRNTVCLKVTLPESMSFSEDVASRESKVIEGYVQLAIRTMLVQSGYYNLPGALNLIPEHPSDEEAAVLIRRAAELIRTREALATEKA